MPTDSYSQARLEDSSEDGEPVKDGFDVFFLSFIGLNQSQDLVICPIHMALVFRN